jgi:ribonuclease Y
VEDPVIFVFVLIALAVGVAVGALVVRSRTAGSSSDTQAIEAESQKLLAAARAEAESLRQNAQVQGKELAFKLKAEVEDEVRKRRTELAKKEEALAAREEQAERKSKEAQQKAEEAQKREKTLGQREEQAEAALKNAEQALAEAKVNLEKIAGLTAAEAQKKLTAQIADEAQRAAAIEIKKIEAQAKEESAEKARTIIATAIQRYASEYVGERTVSVVPLPSDDMKGRLIGREGRNVRALEAATGIDLIIDDTPEAITISCFNPVRREVARLAIGKLVADGRIHPTRIEEVVRKAENDIEQQCVQAGEQAVFDLGLHRLHAELVKLLGGLKFRSSHAQNLLQHSIEVGFLAGLIAAELGQNVKLARRAGLLHDIGKAVDHEHDGSHAAAGAALCKKYGESPRVVQAVAAHHGEVDATTLLDHIVDAANVLSNQRPGARREQLEGYVKRLHDLEKLASGHPGVEKVFAIQAGRELRVMVDNATITDEQSVVLARDLAKKIEGELAYPGQVRVCVLRQTRATDYAK